MHQFLTKIKQTVQQRLQACTTSYEEMVEQAQAARKPHPFLSIFTKDHLPHIIAEIKFASPSKGKFTIHHDPVEIAGQYLAHGASALSVLTIPDYFQGSMDYLKIVRDVYPEAKLLMKDFILDERQLLMARIMGADAVLLIVAFLTEEKLQKLYHLAKMLELTPLIEVHTLEELQIAQALGAEFIGVNNRNLQTLQVDLSTSKKLITHALSNSILISESGFHTGEEISMMHALGYRGFLIGSHFMQDPVPGQALARILKSIKQNSEIKK